MHLAFLYPQLKKLTGAQRLILQLAGATVAAGVPVTLVTHRVADEPRAFLPPGVALVETGQRVDGTGQHYADAAREYALAPALVSHIPQDSTAIVGFGPPTMPALWWARRRGWGSWGGTGYRARRPLLAFLYEPPRFVDRDRADVAAGLGVGGRAIAPLFALYRPVDARFVAAADALLANGEYGAVRLRAAYGRDATTIPHGVDLPEASLDAIAAVRERYGIAANVPFLLSVNQLHPRKRLDLFVRTLAAVRQVFPDARGVLVGRGVDEGRLRSETWLRGVADATVFAGFVPDADLAALYGAASVYLHTGRDETFGLSVLEAAWFGLPVVAVDEGGPREILRGDPGTFVPATVDALAAAVVATLRDPDAARTRADAARASVRGRYAWAAGAAALIAAVECISPSPVGSGTENSSPSPP